MSPEHPLVDSIVIDSQKEEINRYKMVCQSKSELERTELNKDKTGVFTGSYAVNLDPDDWIESNAYENVVEIIKKYSPDVIAFGMKKEYEKPPIFGGFPLTFSMLFF